ncbi:unnamed protein product [Lactuca saligna]|uniref:Uncharacterized protein n=1 Tax=Lactuca saligna TaxID=75948 RepID=A0AA36E0S4_LACSI|nr:unnamed protein product [Lactuca saligna]
MAFILTSTDSFLHLISSSSIFSIHRNIDEGRCGAEGDEPFIKVKSTSVIFFKPLLDLSFFPVVHTLVSQIDWFSRLGVLLMFSCRSFGGASAADCCCNCRSLVEDRSRSTYDNVNLYLSILLLTTIAALSTKGEEPPKPTPWPE